MRIELAYGHSGLWVELPEGNVVKCLRYREAPPLADASETLCAGLANPIGSPPLVELARGKRSACVVICDVTRPVPNALILPPILAALEQGGIPRDGILILVATGLHRPNVGDELRAMVGDFVFDNFRIENHFGHEPAQHAFLGHSPRGVPIWIDGRYLAAELKIATGLIEPHFMAGFSGGRKPICPGIAAAETIQAWHSPLFLEHPNARSGSLDSNPVHEENTYIARKAGCDFIVNTVLNADRRVLKIVCGDMEAAFHEGVAFSRQVVVDRLSEPADIVVTSAAGYPLDATYYQSVKGMVAALPIVKQGGTIIIASGMSEGIGSKEFQQIFADHATLEGFMESILAKRYFMPDQWQLEEFAKVYRKAKIKVVTNGLTPEVLRRMFVEPAASVEAAVAEALALYGPGATIAVVPEGPYVLAEGEERS